MGRMGRGVAGRRSEAADRCITPPRSAHEAQGDQTRSALEASALETLFFNAHTQRAWLDQPVDDALLRRLYDTAKLAPTSANVQPVRLVFVKSAEAKERLKPTLFPQNPIRSRGACSETQFNLPIRAAYR